MKSIAFTFGRFNPPTVGHEKLIDKTRGANRNYRVYASQSQDPKKNPLNFRNKVAIMKSMFPAHARKISTDKMTTAIDAMVNLYKEKYTDVLMVVGSDRVKEFDALLKKYNGKRARHGFYKFKSIRVISAGERDPDAEGVSGMSASKMRTAAQDNDFKSFKKGLPPKFKQGRLLFTTLQKEMGVKTFKNFSESVIDIPRKMYAKNIFDKAETNNPKLKPEVIAFVDKGLKEFESIAPIIDYQLIGSILTHRYRADADLDINVWFDVKTEEKHLELRKKAAEVNGRNVPGTKHPVNYFAVITKEYFERAGEMADATFNIKENKLSRSAVEKSFGIERYMDEFNMEVSRIDIIKGELQRDIIDYKELSDLEPDEIVELKVKLEGKLKEIEKDTKDLIDIYSTSKEERRTAFETPMTPKQITKWGEQQRLPKNVVYKMLEKYYYFDFIHKLEEIIGDDDRLDDKEVKKLIKLAQPTPLPSTKGFAEWLVLGEVAPPRWGHTVPDKPKGTKVGGTAQAMKKAQARGDIPKDMNIYALMWSMKNKGDKPHYKPGEKDVLKKKYRGKDGENEATEVKFNPLPKKKDKGPTPADQLLPKNTSRSITAEFEIEGFKDRLYRKEFEAAAKMYYQLRKKRVSTGTALHRAAGTHRHVSDRGLQTYINSKTK